MLASAVLLGSLAVGCSDDASDAPRQQEHASSHDVHPTPESDAPVAASEPEHVVAISIDGLNVDAIDRLGPRRTPALHRLMREGVSTLNARTAVEMNVTLPNHVGMVTGRRVAKEAGGHGVTWNVDLPDDTMQRSSGDVEASSIFQVAHEAKLRTALFSAKDKFNFFVDSWPDAIDEFVVEENNARLVERAAEHLARAKPDLLFLHVANPDSAGHRAGGMTAAYLKAVRRADHEVATLLRTIDTDPELAGSTTVVLTSDHGFAADHKRHAALEPANFTVPFMVWGPGISPGDLYDVNTVGFADPGSTHPGYAGAQPVRNLDLAGVVTSELGLPPVPGAVSRRPLRLR